MAWLNLGTVALTNEGNWQPFPQGVLLSSTPRKQALTPRKQAFIYRVFYSATDFRLIYASALLQACYYKDGVLFFTEGQVKKLFPTDTPQTINHTIPEDIWAVGVSELRWQIKKRFWRSGFKELSDFSVSLELFQT